MGGKAERPSEWGSRLPVDSRGRKQAGPVGAPRLPVLRGEITGHCPTSLTPISGPRVCAWRSPRRALPWRRLWGNYSGVSGVSCPRILHLTLWGPGPGGRELARCLAPHPNGSHSSQDSEEEDGCCCDF